MIRNPAFSSKLCTILMVLTLICPSNETAPSVLHYLSEDNEIINAKTNSSYYLSYFRTPVNSQCNGIEYLVGVPQNSISESLRINVPEYLNTYVTSLQINATIIFGGYWGPTTTLTLTTLYTSTVLVSLLKTDIITANNVNQNCGNSSLNSTNENYIYNFSVTLYYLTTLYGFRIEYGTAETIPVFTVNSDSTDSAWFAIRDIYLTFVETTVTQNIENCPSYTYLPSLSTMTCVSCPPLCTVCTSYTYCTSCISGLTAKNGVCTLNCSSAQYFDSSLASCQPCDPTCLTCSGPKNFQCVTCNSTLNLFLSSNSCISCSSGQYYNTTTQICKSCNSTCTECSGQLGTQCTACIAPYFLNAGACKLCPNGSYYNTTSSGYQACNSSCYTCSVISTNCTACNAPKYLSGGQCLSCQTGQYYNSTNQSCGTCDSSCYTCTGSRSNQCSLCPTNYYLSFFQCFPCPSGQYSQTGGNGNCLDCNTNCQTCYGTATNCTTCSGTMVVSGSQCVNTGCSTGEFLILGHCEMCSTFCTSCLGSEASNCTGCAAPYVLNQFPGQCIACAAGTYYDNSTLPPQCSACNSSCLNCSGPGANNCTACYAPVALNSGSCSQCATNMYYDFYASACENCDPSCSTCNAGTNTNCLSCPFPTYLSSGKCLSCPNGQYLDSSSPASCQNCSSNCATCSMVSNNCTSCKTAMQLISNQCVSCNSTQYFDYGSQMCGNCSSSCKTCNGPSSNACTSCGFNLTLSSNGNCVPCSSQTYYDNATSLCLSCNSSCANCFGPNSTQCLSCNPDLVLNSTACVPCPNGTYYNSDSSNCSNCDSSCATCSGQGPNSCLTCAAQLLYTSNFMSCTSNCPNLYVIDASGVNCILPNITNSSSSLTSELNAISTMVNGLQTTPDNLAAPIYANLSLELANLLNQSTSTNGTGCPGCSGHGSCEYQDLYLSSSCVCDSGWVSSNCNLDQNDANLAESITLQMLNRISSAGLHLTVDSNWSADYLQSMLNLMNTSYTTDNEVQTTMSIIFNIVNGDYNARTTGDVFDHTKMTIVAQALDECMSYIFHEDCYLQQDLSQKIYTQAEQVMSELGVLQLYGKAPDSGDQTLVTNDFIIFSSRVSVGNLLQEQASFPDLPKIVLSGDTSSASSTQAVDIQAVYWKNNLMECPQVQQENNTAPLVSFSLMNPDSLTTSAVAQLVSATILYPTNSNTTFECASGCSAKQPVYSANQYYQQCYCQSITSLGLDSQFLQVFADSNLYKLVEADALKYYDYLHSWPFWLLISDFAWLILSVLVVKIDPFPKLEFKNPTDPVTGCRIIPPSLRAMRLQASFWKLFGQSILYGHALLSVYSYEDTTVPRLARAVLLYCRAIILMTFSSIFNKVTKTGSPLQVAIVLILPSFTVLPLNIVLQLLFVNEPSRKLRRINSKRGGTRRDLQRLKTRAKRIALTKRILGVILVLAVFAGCNYSVLVIAANSTSTEITQWLKSYFISFAQDMLTTEVVKVLLNVILIRALTRQPGRCSYKAMKLMINPLIMRAVAMSNFKRPA